MHAMRYFLWCFLGRSCGSLGAVRSHSRQCAAAVHFVSCRNSGAAPPFRTSFCSVVRLITSTRVNQIANNFIENWHSQGWRYQEQSQQQLEEQLHARKEQEPPPQQPHQPLAGSRPWIGRE